MRSVVAACSTMVGSLIAGEEQPLPAQSSEPTSEAVLESPTSHMSPASKPKVSLQKREACQLLRFFVYGKVGNEEARTVRERDRVFHETCGTRDNVGLLHGLWRKLDEDHSGRADLAEFRNFAEQRLTEMARVGEGDAEYAVVIAALPWE